MLQKNGVAQAVVINSGIANACTGEEGYRNVQTTAECVAKEFGIQTEQVMVMSTGVIGQPLPMDIICQGVGKLHQALGNDEQSGHDAAEAILTTDTYDPSEYGNHARYHYHGRHDQPAIVKSGVEGAGRGYLQYGIGRW